MLTLQKPPTYDPKNVRPIEDNNRDENGYCPAYSDIAQGMALMGASDRQIASRFEIDEKRFKEWMFIYPELYAKVMWGREGCIHAVAESLVMRAIGFSYKAKKVWQHNGTVIEAETDTYVLPDVQAAIFVLTNRRPDQWANRSNHEVSGPGGKPIQVEDVTARELLERKLAGLADRFVLEAKPGDFERVK